MDTYPSNATSIERLHWYRDNDMEGGLILAQLLDYLEECFSIELTFDES